MNFYIRLIVYCCRKCFRFLSWDNGISWGDAKNKLFNKANDSLLPIRERYFELKEQKDLVKDYLSDGAKKVRPFAQEFIEEIRSKIGIS